MLRLLIYQWLYDLPGVLEMQVSSTSFEIWGFLIHLGGVNRATCLLYLVDYVVVIDQAFPHLVVLALRDVAL